MNRDCAFCHTHLSIDDGEFVECALCTYRICPKCVTTGSSYDNNRFHRVDKLWWCTYCAIDMKRRFNNLDLTLKK